MAAYDFVTVWRIVAPTEAVWDALFQIEQWPSWWDHVKSVVELEPGDENGLGARRHLIWRTRLPYELAFDAQVTHVERPSALEAIVNGDVEGSGRWTLFRDGAVTKVRYDWNVRTTKRWMDWSAPLARPIFEWNHDSVMERGGEALARKLGASFLGMER
jgi:uncharacterized membrane protein